MKKLIFIFSIGLLFAACEEEDVAPIVDPATFPTASFALRDGSHQGAVFNEKVSGDPVDTIFIDITMDKAIAYNTAFTAYPDSTSTATLGEDYLINNGSIPAYGTTGQMSIVILSDQFPEVDETVKLVVKPMEGSDGEQYDLMLNPATEYLDLNFTIANTNSPDGLTAAVGWNEEQASDMDVVVFDSMGTEVGLLATSDNPELGLILPNTAPDGTYYVNIDDYAVENPPVDYTFTFGSPDGTVTIYEGSFDTTDTSQYTSDFSAVLGSDTYRFVQVDKTGSDYTLTHLEAQ